MDQSTYIAYGSSGLLGGGDCHIITIYAGVRYLSARGKGIDGRGGDLVALRGRPTRISPSFATWRGGELRSTPYSIRSLGKCLVVAGPVWLRSVGFLSALTCMWGFMSLYRLHHVK